MIIVKFGGTSLCDASMIERCLDVSANHLSRNPIVVAAALSGVTDALLLISEFAAAGNAVAAANRLAEVRARHVETLEELCSAASPITETIREELSIEPLLDQLESLIEGLLLLRECTPRTLDTIMSFGELLSTRLIARCAAGRGIAFDLVDARSIIVTDNTFTAAVPDIEATNERIRERFLPGNQTLTITQGFIGSTLDGATTTIGRGGSDYTAALIGAAVGASEIQLWTDVNGIMTCDPNIVRSAKTVGKVSYTEAAELAFFGSNVVHPSTLQPAIDESIPVLVRNIRDPAGRFTAIVERCYETGVRSIAGKRSVTLVNISSSRMLNSYGFMSRFFMIFAENHTSVDLIATSEVSVTVSVDNMMNIDSIVRALKKIGTVASERDMAIVSLVGQDLWKDSSVVAEVFSVLREIPIRMISLGSSDINLSVVVPNDFFEVAMRSLHNRFFGSS